LGLSHAEDPDDAVVAVEFGSEEEARPFVEDPSVRDATERAGAEGEPHVRLRERVPVVEC
jgi:hypothetical protein